MGTALKTLRKLQTQPWLALDTETTGLGPYDVVIEIALIDPRGVVVADTTVAPDRPVTAKSRAVHGIDAETLAASPSWTNVWPNLQPHLRAHPVVAWNAAFDLRLLRQTCARNRLPLVLRQVLCLQQAFTDHFPVTRATLAAACLTLGVVERPTHRARVDAEVARQVALKLMKLS